MALDISGFRQAAQNITQFGLQQGAARPKTEAVKAGLNTFISLQENKRRNQVTELQGKLQQFKVENTQNQLAQEKSKIQNEQKGKALDIISGRLSLLSPGDPQIAGLIDQFNVNAPEGAKIDKEAAIARNQEFINDNAELEKMRVKIDSTTDPKKKTLLTANLDTAQQAFVNKYQLPKDKIAAIQGELDVNKQAQREFREARTEEIRAGIPTEEEKALDIDIKKQKLKSPEQLNVEFQNELLTNKKLKSDIRKSNVSTDKLLLEISKANKEKLTPEQQRIRNTQLKEARNTLDRILGKLSGFGVEFSPKNVKLYKQALPKIEAKIAAGTDFLTAAVEALQESEEVKKAEKKSPGIIQEIIDLAGFGPKTTQESIDSGASARAKALLR